MYVVDANVWVSMFLEDEPRSQESYHFIRGVSFVFVPELVLPEVAGAIGRQRLPTRGLEAMSTLLSFADVAFFPVDRALAHASALLAATLGLRGADAVYVALAEARQVPLVTWDSDLLKRAAPAVTVLTPAQVLSP